MLKKHSETSIGIFSCVFFFEKTFLQGLSYINGQYQHFEHCLYYVVSSENYRHITCPIFSSFVNFKSFHIFKHLPLPEKNIIFSCAFFSRKTSYRVCHLVVTNTNFPILNTVYIINFVVSSENYRHISCTISYTYLQLFRKHQVFPDFQTFAVNILESSNQQKCHSMLSSVLKHKISVYGVEDKKLLTKLVALFVNLFISVKFSN